MCETHVEIQNVFQRLGATLVITAAGTEQHRHNTAEVAVYSIISYLWGLETRGHYAMTKVSEVAGKQVGEILSEGVDPDRVCDS